jgi:hypothetical protein
MGFDGRKRNLDSMAMFHRAKLLELLDAFESSGRKLREDLEELVPVCVKAQMLQEGYGRIRRVSAKGNRGARKIKGLSPLIHHHLDDVGIEEIMLILTGKRERRHGRIIRPHQCLDKQIDHRRIECRLISLDVHDNVVVSQTDPAGGFRQTIGAARVMLARQECLAPKSTYRIGYPDIVGCDKKSTQAVCPACTLIDMLNHRFAENIRQGLPGVTTRTISSWNDSDYLHHLSLAKEALSAVHGLIAFFES